MMTPTRAKRNSKAPNRFSSDSVQTHGTESNSDSNLGHNDDGTTNKNNSTSINKIKLKPLTREPLKVKLPKLRRHVPETVHSVAESPVKKSINDVKIHKIKLPSFATKKQDKPNTQQHDSSPLAKIKLPKPAMKFGSSLLSSSSSAARPAKIENVDIAHTFDNASSDDVDGQREDDDEMSSQHMSTQSASPANDVSPNHGASVNSSFSSAEADCDNRLPGMRIEVVREPKNDGSEIRCACGVDDDLGIMLECESCSTWQHGHCINVNDEDAETYEGYVCANCLLPPDQVRGTLKELVVGDKYKSKFDAIARQEEEEQTCDDLLSLDDISNASRDLERVLGSVRSKLGLLNRDDYAAELRIWQNPYWVDESATSQAHKSGSFYFLDRCRDNLRANICNLVDKMRHRVRMMRDELSRHQAAEQVQRSVDLLAQAIEVEAAKLCS